jgi:hypothetical protein
MNERTAFQKAVDGATKDLEGFGKAWLLAENMRLKATIKRVEEENEKLKLALEFDEALDDADWQPPHPIFLLAEENDMLRATIRRIAALPEEFERKDENGWVYFGHGCAKMLRKALAGEGDD